jgi:hypothetical protein
MSVGTRCAYNATHLYPQKLADALLVSVVRLRTKIHGVFVLFFACSSLFLPTTCSWLNYDDP